MVTVGRKWRLTLASLLVYGCTFGQSNDSNNFTDEDLRSYALLQEWVDIQTDSIRLIYNQFLKNLEHLKHQNLSDLKQKRNTANSQITPSQEEEFVKLDSLWFELSGVFKSQYIQRVDSMLSKRTYNVIRLAITSNDSIRTQYNQVLNRIRNESEKPKADLASDK